MYRRRNVQISSSIADNSVFRVVRSGATSTAAMAVLVIAGVGTGLSSTMCFSSSGSRLSRPAISCRSAMSFGSRRVALSDISSLPGIMLQRCYEGREQPGDTLRCRSSSSISIEHYSDILAFKQLRPLRVESAGGW